MSKNTKRVLDDCELNSSSIKHVHHNITCLFDLSDEILLLICRYLSPSCILYSFYTPSKPEQRLHRVIFDYYTNIKLDRITNDEYRYLSRLFCSSNFPLKLKSLILSNEHITCLIRRYFNDISLEKNPSIFTNLKRVTLIDCFPEDLELMDLFYMKQIEYISITVRKFDENKILSLDKMYLQTSNVSILKILFDGQMSSINTAFIQINDGLILTKSLIPHQNIRNINLVLQTIDDLYVLLDGIIPNIEIMIIQLCKPRRLSRHHPKSKPSCPRLIEFTLLEGRIGLVITDIKCILGYMNNLIKLILSIRDTTDPIFCHGPNFESILNEYIPHLHKFQYTMTHRIGEKTLIEDFIQWPMDSVFYENENCKWIHIYSFPWPLNKDDKRRLPIVHDGSNLSVRSDVKRCEYMNHVMIRKSSELMELKTHFHRAYQITSCLSIDIKLPRRISKVILTNEARIVSTNLIIQPFVNHLIVECRLNNEREMSILAHQYPNVKYLKLLLPFDKSSYINCLKNLFSLNDNDENKLKFWSKLINFSTELFDEEINSICCNSELYDWLIENTDLKYHKYPFYANCLFPRISIWL